MFWFKKAYQIWCGKSPTHQQHILEDLALTQVLSRPDALLQRKIRTKNKLKSNEFQNLAVKKLIGAKCHHGFFRF